MKRKEFYILAALAIISGLVGGLLSGRLTSSTAFAQADRVLEVETLRIMDKDGVPRISLTATNEEPRIVFIDKDGQVQSFLGVRSDGSVTLTLAASSGKTNADSEINHKSTTKSDAAWLGVGSGVGGSLLLFPPGVVRDRLNYCPVHSDKFELMSPSYISKHSGDKERS